MTPRTKRTRTYGVKLVRGPFVRLEPHELACETEDELLGLAESLRRTGDRRRAADLFCGAGGLSLGLEEAGFDVILGVDHDDEALETHRSLCSGLSVNWDLGDDDVVHRIARLIEQTGISLVAGGPPCQPFSKAGRSMIRELVRTGRRPRHDQRRDLWESFLQVIALALPEAVLMENVPDMALDRDMLILRTMVDELENLGYSVEERVVEAWRYGVPQFRTRLILVALRNVTGRGVLFTWPKPAERRVTVDNAIGDLPEVDGGWRPTGGADGWIDYDRPLTSFQKTARAALRGAARSRIFDHITRPVREDDALAFAQMDPTTRYSDLDAGLKRYRDDIFDDKYKRLDPNDLGRTITAHIAKDGYWYIHPYQDRTLTIREAARLQTFPDRVRFAGAPSAAFRQIGNAVPPLLARRIGVAILRSVREDRRPPVDSRMVSQELAAWFDELDELTVPWLRAANRWQVVMGELLLGRAQERHVRLVWPAIEERCATPRATLRAEEVLRRMAGRIGREARAAQIIETAQWFLEEPDSLRTSEGLRSAPNVGPAVADLAVRIVPDSEDPVLATGGVLRVAARFTGEPVNRTNRLSDGRMAVARMIGADTEAPSDGRPAPTTCAHLGIMELAARVCRPEQPDCARCPLTEWCESADAFTVSEAG